MKTFLIPCLLQAELAASSSVPQDRQQPQFVLKSRSSVNL